MGIPGAWSNWKPLERPAVPEGAPRPERLAVLSENPADQGKGIDAYTGLPASVGSGRELGYAEITSVYGSAALAAALADIPGLSVTVTCDGVRPVEIVAEGLFQKLANAGLAVFYLYEGATQLALNSAGNAAINEAAGFRVSRRLIPTAGVHTYNVKMAMTSVGGQLSAGPGSPNGPASLAVIER